MLLVNQSDPEISIQQQLIHLKKKNPSKQAALCLDLGNAQLDLTLIRMNLKTANYDNTP